MKIYRANVSIVKVLAACSVVGFILAVYYFLWLEPPTRNFRYDRYYGAGVSKEGQFRNTSFYQANPSFSKHYENLAFGFTPRNKKAGEIFDKDMQSYEIKSCLSPDLEKHERSTCRFFAIMLDAGSTGTRVHIFEFSHDIKNFAAPFKLEQEVYSQVTPGLSSYMSNPEKAAESILPLIKKAKATVPKSQWKHTPISLKATAGLRLLSEKQAEKIIFEVDKLLDSTGFLTNEESVSIMTGTDEGIFGWFTLNFLLDRLGALKQEPLNDLIGNFINKSINRPELQTVAALDLGGGSTQITFRPKLNSTLIQAPDEFVRQIKLVGRFIDLYTHSYLGNGLMAARLGSLLIANNIKDNTTKISRFQSKCLPPSSSLLWTYNDITYNVSGKSPYNFQSCLTEQEGFTNASIIDYPAELSNRDIYVFGYFFDRARQSGLTAGNGGYASISDFASAAKKACTKRRLGSKDHEQWMCRDLSYIVALLRAYKLPLNKKFFLARRIRNMEVSWALGASYHLLNSYHESAKKSQFSQNAVEVTSQKIQSTKSCPCDTMLLMSGGVLRPDWLNLTTLFLCSRVYYGLLSLLPSAYMQLA